MSHEGNDRIIDKAIDDMIRGIECPSCSYTDTYTHRSEEHGLILTCTDCDDRYEISFSLTKRE